MSDDLKTATRDRVQEVARRHLDASTAERWLNLTRPAAQLVPASAGDVVVARIGGVPDLPMDVAWPVWDGHGPLTFVAEVDCAALVGWDLGGTPLPQTGRLLFFYFDGSYDDFEGIVGPWSPDSQAGARTLYIPDGTARETRPTPPGVLELKARELTARPALTWIDWEHPDLKAEFLAPGAPIQDLFRHPVAADPFNEELRELRNLADHRIGGWPNALQGPVEGEVDEFLGESTPARDWHVLLQVDTDQDLEWGDGGTLYWMVRGHELADGETSQVVFTWQCL